MGIVRIPTKYGKDIILDEEDFARFGHMRFHLSAKKYVGVKIKRRPYYLHRLVMDAGPGDIVDHIDGNGFNNARANLRLASWSDNNQKGTRLRRNNKSGFVGVTFARDHGRWLAQAVKDYRHYHLGYFDTPEGAARAYDAFVRQHRGPLARVNFPEEAA